MNIRTLHPHNSINILPWSVLLSWSIESPHPAIVSSCNELLNGISDYRYYIYRTHEMPCEGIIRIGSNRFLEEESGRFRSRSFLWLLRTELTNLTRKNDYCRQSNLVSNWLQNNSLIGRETNLLDESTMVKRVESTDEAMERNEWERKIRRSLLYLPPFYPPFDARMKN